MRVLYHHRTLAEDAQGVHIEEIVRALRARGHTVKEVSLVARGGGASSPKAGAGGDGSSNTVADRSAHGANESRGAFWKLVAKLAKGPLYEILEYLYNVPAERRLRAEIRAFRPHLVYERYALSTVAGIRAARAEGVPHCLEVNAPLVDEKSRWSRLWFGRLARRVERWIFRNTDRVIVVSDVLADTVESLGAPRDSICVVRNGADASRFHPRTPGGAVREAWGTEGRVVLGFVGWFREWHGIESIVEAMADAKLRDVPLHLALVGDGPARASIEAKAAELGLSDRITITGAVARGAMPRHVAAFDIALQPAATAYACPMKIPEYLAGAKPVIAPDQPNIRELVRDGREGLLFERGNRASLVDAILRLAGDAELRKELGANARTRALDEGYSWLKNADRIATIRDELALPRAVAGADESPDLASSREPAGR